MTDFDRAPNKPSLELDFEFQGSDGLVKVHVQPLGDGTQIDIETIHGRTCLSFDDFNAIDAKLAKYMDALRLVEA
jgi:hypothetical protein